MYTECKISVYQQDERFGIRREYYDEGSLVSSEDADALYDDFGTAKFEAEEYVETMNGESGDDRFRFVE